MTRMAVIPVRMDSSRLPGKALRPILGEPMLGRLIERVRRSEALDDVLIATTTLPSDDALEALADELGVRCFRGDPEDVLGRIHSAVEAHDVHQVVELMGDSPLVHSALIEDTITLYERGSFDYVTSRTATVHIGPGRPTHGFPVGLWVQVFDAEFLARCHAEASDPFFREHSTSFMFKHPNRWSIGYFDPKGSWSPLDRPELFWAVNTAEQFAQITAIFEACYPDDSNFHPERALERIPRDEAQI
ncbi:MAG: NTP transferase domain-containing protein [Myxococcota bacterium]